VLEILSEVGGFPLAYIDGTAKEIIEKMR